MVLWALGRATLHATRPVSRKPIGAIFRSMIDPLGLISTLMVVDDTFARYREQMAAVIAQAKAWAGL
jgi:hypothetical protein